MRTFVKQGVRHFFSFETILVLFLFAGSFKSASFIQSAVPVDLTLFFFLLSIFTGLVILFKKNWIVKMDSFYMMTVFILLTAYSIASVMWSPSEDYAREKALYMATTVLWSVAASALIISEDERRVRRFIVLLIIMGSWQSLQSLKAYLGSSEEGFITIMGASYLGTGQIIGLGAIAVLSALLLSNQRVLLRFPALVLYIAMVLALFILGGRGPLLGTFLAMLFALAYAVKVDGYKLFIRKYAFFILLLAASALIFIWYLIITGHETQTVARLLMLVEGSDTSSAGIRAEYYGRSVEFWKQAPLFGHGLGSWPVLYDGTDQRNYPHNMFLEVLAELGIIGFSLLCLLLALGMKNLLRSQAIRENQPSMGVALLFVCSFFNILVSGDLPDNRTFFCLLGLMPFIKNCSSSFSGRSPNDEKESS